MEVIETGNIHVCQFTCHKLDFIGHALPVGYVIDVNIIAHSSQSEHLLDTLVMLLRG